MFNFANIIKKILKQSGKKDLVNVEKNSLFTFFLVRAETPRLLKFNSSSDITLWTRTN